MLQGIYKVIFSRSLSLPSYAKCFIRPSMSNHIRNGALVFDVQNHKGTAEPDSCYKERQNKINALRIL